MIYQRVGIFQNLLLALRGTPIYGHSNTFLDQKLEVLKSPKTVHNFIKLITDNCPFRGHSVFERILKYLEQRGGNVRFRQFFQGAF